MLRVMRKINRNQKGITGLETAIILIAFVVVAAVFAYTVLSAGLFSTESSKEAVYAGLETAQSTLELKGSVVALEDADGDEITQIEFNVALALDGEPINFTVPTDDSPQDKIADSDTTNVVIISLIDKDQRVDDLLWSKAVVGKGDTDDLLEPGEVFRITVGGGTEDTDDLKAALTAQDLVAMGEFTLEVKPPVGASLIIQRTLPDTLDPYNDLL